MEVKGSTTVEQPQDINAQTLAGMTDEDLAKALEAPAAPAPVSDTGVKDKQDKVPEPVEEAPAEDKAPDLKEENAKLQRQLDNLKQVFGRQSNELGELRAKLKAKPTAEDFDTDPVKAAETLQERTEQEREIQKKETEQQYQAIAIRNMQYITEHAPDLSVNMDAIKQVMLNEDKLVDDDVQKFTGNIFLQNPWGVFQLNERAKLYAKNKQLEKRIAELEKAPGKVLSKIADISKSASNVSSSTGHSSNAPATSTLSAREIADMTDDELEAYLKSRRKG